MTTAPPRPVVSPPPAAPRPRRAPDLVAPVGAGLALMLAAAPVSAVVQGSAWARYAGAFVALAVAVGMLLAPAGGVVVVVGQLAAALLLLTALFADTAVLGVLPGPDAWVRFRGLVDGAAEQIATGIAPVPATPEILFLVTVAFALTAVVVHAVAVSARAPAAAAVPLLAVFAVPTALADDLLPWWALAAAAAGLGVLLLTGGGGARRAASRAPGGVALTTAAVVLALLAGVVAGGVGTAGRFGGGGSGAGGSIGLTPFTALRGQLEQGTPTELFQVTGLPRPTYLRALTLRDYVPEAGWQASRPAPGTPLTGPLPGSPAPGERASVEVENLGFRDYWLPLYGAPLAVTGVADEGWAFDEDAGTAYTVRPREEEGWAQDALLPAPSAQQLRDAGDAADGVSRAYLNTQGVDARVAELAAEVTAGAATRFDQALALNDYFTAPGSPFTYSLRTAPGSGDDALVEFLTVGRTGYCEQFASAMAVMLRTVGVPARVAVGFTAGAEAEGVRTVTTADAHAWVEAWFPGIGWTTFDPTPLTDGRAVVPPYVSEARLGDAAGTPEDQDELPADAAAPPTAQDLPTPEPTPEPLPAAGPGPVEEGGVPWWPAAIVVAVAVAALAPAGRRELLRRRRLTTAGAGGRAAAAAGWAEILAESTDRGVPAAPNDTVRATARRLVREHHLDAAAQEHLRRVVGAVEASFYGGADAAPGELDASVRAVRDAVAAGSPAGARERLFPRSVLAGVRIPRRGGADRHEDAGAR